MADASLAERIIRAETTEILKQLRNDLLERFSNIPNGAEIVDRDYAFLKDELTKRGAI